MVEHGDPPDQSALQSEGRGAVGGAVAGLGSYAQDAVAPETDADVRSRAIGEVGAREPGRLARCHGPDVHGVVAHQAVDVGGVLEAAREDPAPEGDLKR